MDATSHESSKRAVIAAAAANLGVAIAKAVAAVITGSSAMGSEAVHSIADTTNEALLWIGLRGAKRASSTNHPFGNGKEQYFWSFLVGVMLFTGGGVLAVIHGVGTIMHPRSIEHAAINYVVLAISFVLEALSLRVARREFNKERGHRHAFWAFHEGKNTTVLVVLVEDTAALIGLSIAAAGLTGSVVTGNSLWDGLASIAIGVLLGVAAVAIGIETKELLIGEAAGRSVRADIRAAVIALEPVESIGRLLTMHMGPERILVNIEIDFSDDELVDIVEATRAIEDAIRSAAGNVGDIFVEAIEHD